MLDSKFLFDSHVDYVVKPLGTQYRIISKIRHFVPQKALLLYYNSNIKYIIQYGVLVYNCCFSSRLLRIQQMKKKILKLIHFRRKREHLFDLFEKHNVLFVFGLRVYELMKFVLHCINR